MKNVYHHVIGNECSGLQMEAWVRIPLLTSCLFLFDNQSFLLNLVLGIKGNVWTKGMSYSELRGTSGLKVCHIVDDFLFSSEQHIIEFNSLKPCSIPFLRFLHPEQAGCQDGRAV